MLELDFAIDQNGLVAPDHAARYREFGDWIRSCYGTPVATTSGNGTVFQLNLTSYMPAVDRIQIRENQAYGQRIRAYYVEYLAAGHVEWVHWFQGTSVGTFISFGAK